MAGGAADAGSSYSPSVAFIYVFNLVVGTGALALPSVLTSGGWYLGALFLLLVACLSYIGVTFIVEAMAAANAILYWERKIGGDNSDEEEAPLVETAVTPTAFEIVKRTELGQMADMFFSRWGRVFFYAALILYLFGDAAIYCTFVPRSLVGFFYGGNEPPPWAFDAFLATFVALIVPFCFFDFQKTKVLQIGTLLIRNAAILTMVVLALKAVRQRGPRTEGVPYFKLQSLPNLFGGAVYAFMCHHSLPGIITPMREKSLISRVTFVAFVGIFFIYLLLFISCGLAFGLKAEDPITFNFPPEKYGWIGDLLFLFPVFTLSSNFPMLSITLRNNLDTLLQLITVKVPVKVDGEECSRESFNVDKSGRRRVVVTVLAVAPPIVCCVIAEHAGLDVNSLVGITGAYAGAAVMFIIPACLVHCSRLVIARKFPATDNRLSDSHPLNIHSSPFRGRKWVITLIMAAICAISFISWEIAFP